MSRWLTQFFGCNVGFDLDRIQGRAAPYDEPLQTLLGRCIASCEASEGPCVLPVVLEDKQVDLLVAATQPEKVSELHSIAKAYLGSFYARVRSQIVSVASSSAEACVLDRMPGGIVQIRVPRQASGANEYRNNVYKAIEIVLEFVEQFNNRPPLLSHVRRSTGRVLRDFFVALRDGDAESSRRYLDELGQAGSVSARNMLFLEIQSWAAFEDWEAIVNHPKMGDALSGRVPRAVAVAFLMAIDAQFFREEVLRSRKLDAVRARLSSVTSFFSALPDLGQDDASVKVWRSWAIGALLLGNLDVAEKVRERVGGAWFQRISSVLDVQLADEARPFAADDSLVGLIEAPPSIAAAVELLKITLQGNEEQCRVVAEALHAYPAEVVEQLRETPAIRTLLDALVDVDRISESNQGWGQWVTTAQRSQDPASLVQSAINAAAYWDKSGWDEDALLSALDSGDSAVQQVLRDVLPILLNWLDRHEISLGLESTESLLLNLAIDDVSSVQDLSLARDLLGILLAQPHTKQAYTSALEAVQAIWEKIKSVHAVGGICDVFELLLDAPCASGAARLSLWQDLQQFFLSNWKRLDKESRALARALSEELAGSSAQFEIAINEPEHETKIPKVDLSGKKVAIYSLIESAAQRAKRALEELYPEINVVLNHDHDATAALVHLGQTADYFVFASRASKHQAFYTVTKQRSDIIYPDGKGTMSIIRAFSEAVG